MNISNCLVERPVEWPSIKSVSKKKKKKHLKLDQQVFSMIILNVTLSLNSGGRLSLLGLVASSALCFQAAQLNASFLSFSLRYTANRFRIWSLFLFCCFVSFYEPEGTVHAAFEFGGELIVLIRKIFAGGRETSIWFVSVADEIKSSDGKQKWCVCGCVCVWVGDKLFTSYPVLLTQALISWRPTWSKLQAYKPTTWPLVAALDDNPS